MKKSVRKLNYMDLKRQIIIGVLLVILILIIGYIIINYQLKKISSETDKDGNLGSLKMNTNSISTVGCSNKNENDKCSGKIGDPGPLYYGVCCNDKEKSTNSLICVPLYVNDLGESLNSYTCKDFYQENLPPQ